MSNQDFIWSMILMAALAIVVIAGVAFTRRQARLRRAELQRQFGPEYQRTAEELGSSTRADNELWHRARHVARLGIRDLSNEECGRFSREWSQLQTIFVDDPSRAVKQANELIKQVMRACGYPEEDFEQRVEDLSVDHAKVVQHYRAAHTLAVDAMTRAFAAGAADHATTEDLRHAMLHFRVLFADLLRHSRPSVGELRHAVANA